jgi:hypothetical protein
MSDAELIGGDGISDHDSDGQHNTAIRHIAHHRMCASVSAPGDAKADTVQTQLTIADRQYCEKYLILLVSAVGIEPTTP